MRLNIGLPGPLSVSQKVSGKGILQGCLVWVAVAAMVIVLCCCAGSLGSAYDRITDVNY